MSTEFQFWADILLRAATLVVAVAAGGVALLTYFHNKRNNRRSAWFDRVRWALELTSSREEAEVALGWSILPTLMEDATKDDQAVAEAVRNFIVGSISPEGDRTHVEAQSPGSRAASTPEPEDSSLSDEAIDGGEKDDS